MSSNASLLAIDPGSRYNGMASKIQGVYNTWELNNHEAVWWTVLNGQWEHVIIEDFVTVEISRYGTFTLKIIGGVMAICYQRNIPITIQQPGERITFIPRADELMLKVHGYKHPRDHEQSAMAHMLKWEKANAK